MRAQGDLGGREAGAIDTSEHELTFFEKRVDALLRLLADPPRSHFAVDAQRRVMETVPEEMYKSLSYYELWMESIKRLVLEKGLINPKALEKRVAEIEARIVAEHATGAAG